MMKSKLWKFIILALFIILFIGAAVWMYKAYVIPNSPYNKEIKLRGFE